MTDDEMPIEEQAFCASCFSAVDESVEICSSCGAALAQSATAGPKKEIARHEGPRKNRTPPSLLIVIGMWLVLLPGLVIAFGVLIEPNDARVRISIIVGLMFWAYGTVLNRVTRRYFESRRQRRTAQAD